MPSAARGILFNAPFEVATSAFRAGGSDAAHDWAELDEKTAQAGLLREILADAIQDAGCENSDVLNHCRDAAERDTGSWRASDVRLT